MAINLRNNVTGTGLNLVTNPILKSSATNPVNIGVKTPVNQYKTEDPRYANKTQVNTQVKTPVQTTAPMSVNPKYQTNQTTVPVQTNTNQSRFIGFQNNNLGLQSRFTQDMQNITQGKTNLTDLIKARTENNKNKQYLDIPTQAKTIKQYNQDQEQRYRTNEKAIEDFHYDVLKFNGKMTADQISQYYPEFRGKENQALELQKALLPYVLDNEFASMEAITQNFPDLLPAKQQANTTEDEAKATAKKIDSENKKHFDRIKNINQNTLSYNGKEFANFMIELSNVPYQIKKNYKVDSAVTDEEIIAYVLNNFPEYKEEYERIQNLQLSDQDKARLGIGGNWLNKFSVGVANAVNAANNWYKNNVQNTLSDVPIVGSIANIPGGVIGGFNKMLQAGGELTNGEFESAGQIASSGIKAIGGGVESVFNTALAPITAAFNVAGETELGKQVEENTLGLAQDGITAFYEKTPIIKNFYNSLDDEAKADLVNETMLALFHGLGKGIKKTGLDVKAGVATDAITNALQRGKYASKFQIWVEKGLADENGKFSDGALKRIVGEGTKEVESALKENFSRFNEVVEARKQARDFKQAPADNTNLEDNRTVGEKVKSEIKNTAEAVKNKVSEVNDIVKEKYTNLISNKKGTQVKGVQQFESTSENNKGLNQPNYTQGNNEIKTKSLLKPQVEFLQTNNKMNPKAIQTFEEKFGESYGQYMYDKGFTKKGESNLEDMATYQKDLMQIKEDALNKIDGKFNDVAVQDMLEVLQDFYTKTKDRKNLDMVENYINQHNNGGLTMPEINKVRKKFQYDIRTNFFKDGNSEKIQLANNVYLAVKDFLDKTAKENGLDSLDEINREIMKVQHIIGGITYKLRGSSANNMLGLTDWISLASMVNNPQAIALFLGKQLAKKERFMNPILNIAVGGRGNAKNRITAEKMQGQLDNIAKINDEKARNKELEKFYNTYIKPVKELSEYFDNSVAEFKKQFNEMVEEGTLNNALPDLREEDVKSGKKNLVTSKNQVTIEVDEKGNARRKGQISESDKRSEDNKKGGYDNKPTEPKKPTTPKDSGGGVLSKTEPKINQGQVKGEMYHVTPNDFQEFKEDTYNDIDWNTAFGTFVTDSKPFLESFKEVSEKTRNKGREGWNTKTLNVDAKKVILHPADIAKAFGYGKESESILIDYLKTVGRWNIEEQKNLIGLKMLDTGERYDIDYDTYPRKDSYTKEEILEMPGNVYSGILQDKFEGGEVGDKMWEDNAKADAQKLKELGYDGVKFYEGDINGEPVFSLALTDANKYLVKNKVTSKEEQKTQAKEQPKAAEEKKGLPAPKEESKIVETRNDVTKKKSEDIEALDKVNKKNILTAKKGDYKALSNEDKKAVLTAGTELSVKIGDNITTYQIEADEGANVIIRTMSKKNPINRLRVSKDRLVENVIERADKAVYDNSMKNPIKESDLNIIDLEESYRENQKLQKDFENIGLKEGDYISMKNGESYKVTGIKDGKVYYEDAKTGEAKSDFIENITRDFNGGIAKKGTESDFNAVKEKEQVKQDEIKAKEEEKVRKEQEKLEPIQSYLDTITNAGQKTKAREHLLASNTWTDLSGKRMFGNRAKMLISLIDEGYTLKVEETGKFYPNGSPKVEYHFVEPNGNKYYTLKKIDFDYVEHQLEKNAKIEEEKIPENTITAEEENELFKKEAQVEKPKNLVTNPPKEESKIDKILKESEGQELKVIKSQNNNLVLFKLNGEDRAYSLTDEQLKELNEKKGNNVEEKSAEPTQEKPKNLVTEKTKQESNTRPVKIQDVDKDTYYNDIMKNPKDHPREMFIYKDGNYYYPSYILPSGKILTPENTYWGEVSSEEAARNWLQKKAEEHSVENETKKTERLKNMVGKTAEKYEETLKRIESDNPMQEIRTSGDYFKYGTSNSQMTKAKKEAEVNAEVGTFKKDVIDGKEGYRIFVSGSKQDAIRAFYEPKTGKAYRIYRGPTISDAKPFTTREVDRIEKFLGNVEKQLEKETKKEKVEKKDVITQEWLDSIKPDRDGVIELEPKSNELYALRQGKESLVKEGKADGKYLQNYGGEKYPQYIAVYIKDGNVYEGRRGLEDQFMKTKQEAVDWLNQKEKDVEHEATARYTQTDYEPLPKTISVESEAEKAGPKRIAPDRVKWQQETYDKGLNNVKDVLKASPLKLYELGFKSDRSKAVQDIMSERKRIRELPEEIAEKQWNELAKSVYEPLVIKDISKGYRYPENVTSKFPKAQMQKAIDARARYEKGLFTSFSNKDTRANNQYRDEIGAGIKSQDGKPVTQEQMNEIVDGIRSFGGVFGLDMKKFAEDNNIIYVHLHGGNPFLMGGGGKARGGGMKIAGLYRKGADGNISISLGGVELVMEKGEDGEMKKNNVNATPEHELAHAFDYMLDNKLFSSQDIEILKKTMNKPTRLINYYNRPQEIVARAVEQYAAKKTGKSRYGRPYKDAKAYWNEENFEKYVKPIVEKNMNEKLKEYKLDNSKKNVISNDKNRVTSK